MTDTGRTFQGPGDDTSRKLVLNEELFRRRTQALGARTDRERCTIAGISKASLHRWRHGSVTPSYTLLRQMARRLNVPVVELTVEVKR
ncbi:helix-turn-helix domain-containing protein [Actinoplanes derwentensis]|uniref:helix-turn-helix domain-containing protein n=1 Tax=Actinoplanes derwentensis TaxID=113562 RepID=UPI000B8862F1|nr:helix-turn-helix transcriptional regulator [Actinoplanes derwentensis]GID81936.1 hypothetical protein Ade03nite_08600 [Actinoplanes derwentensis]